MATAQLPGSKGVGKKQDEFDDYNRKIFDQAEKKDTEKRGCFGQEQFPGRWRAKAEMVAGRGERPWLPSPS